jgi:broad specificity phosphatase PhoE
MPLPEHLSCRVPDLLLLRHGETEWNRAGRFQGSHDSPLTPRGREQAVAMGRLLVRLGVSARAYRARTSPQPRAAESAVLALRSLGIAAVPDPRLAEIGMGRWTGLHRSEIDACWPPPPGGEGLLDFYARCEGGEPLAFVAERAAAVLRSLSGPTILVTHGVTLRLLCAVALGHGWAEAGAYPLRQGQVVRIAGGRMDLLEPEACDRLARPEPGD